MTYDISIVTIDPNYCQRYRNDVSVLIRKLIDDYSFNTYIGKLDPNISNNGRHICSIVNDNNIDTALTRIRSELDPTNKSSILVDNKLYIAPQYIIDMPIVSNRDNTQSIYGHPILMPVKQKIFPNNCINRTTFMNTRLYNDDNTFSDELNLDSYRDWYKNIIQNL